MSLRRNGFTLIEIALVLAVMGVLAAILTPMLGNLIDDARVTRARHDTQTIAQAVLSFRRATGRWPIFISGTSITTTSTTYKVLIGPGSDPAPAGSAWLPSAGERVAFDNILNRNTPGYTTSGRFAWRGPYLASLTADPWGNAYIINAQSLKFGVNEAAFVLSAGANATIETTFQQSIGSGSGAVVVGGDDVVARIR